MTGSILAHSSLSFYYASCGLKLWFEKMIPALLPFMILSGVMIRCRLTEKMVSFVYPLLGRLFRIRKNPVYCIFIGFLCGFPMGAKVTADLLSEGELSREEAQFTLAFCNNIGPVYFCGFVLPLLHRKLVLPYLIGMYGIPFGYGLLLRYTVYRKTLPSPVREKERKASKPYKIGTILGALDISIVNSVKSILNLGGYMILFNLFNIIPHVILGRPAKLLAPILEITGGLQLIGDTLPFYSVLLLSFGGLCCIAQTYCCIRDTELSLSDYVIQKAIQTLLTILYYSGWFLLSPESFLR